MAEISMVQMTGPAVSPGASSDKTQGGSAVDFSELLRDKGQSVSDSSNKTEVKKPGKEQGQTHKPDKKVTAKEDEKQEAKESASSPENTEEGLSLLAEMMLRQTQEVDAVAAEGTAETALTEQVLAVENTETVHMPTEQISAEHIPAEQMPETDVQAAAPVVQETVRPQDTVQTRQTASQEPARQETHAENTVEQTRQPQQVEQAVKPEQPRQENQTAARDQGEAGTDILKESETTVRPEEQFAAQSAANSQFQSQLSAEGTEVPGETAAVKTSEATMYRDIAETLASRVPVKDGTLTLELEPASLGKIIIKVAFEDGKTVMSLMADSHRTLAILSQRAGEMGQILEEKTGQQTVIYTPENQSSQEELPERGGEENRQRQKDAQEENRHNKEGESFMQQLRLGLVG